MLATHPARRPPRRGRADPDRRRAVPHLRRRPRPTTTSPCSATSPRRWRCSSATASALTAGRAAASRPLRRRPADDPQVPGQDQRAVHQAAAQRDGLVDRPADRPADRPLHVLDPMCGRGTTLNQVLMNGWHAAGLDVDARDFDAYAAFLAVLAPAQAAQAHRRGHAAAARRRQARSALPRRDRRTKEEWKAGDAITVDYVNADTLHTRAVHRAASRSTRSSSTRRTASSTAAAPAAGSRAARSTCCARPSPSGPRCCAPAARWGSPGTPTSPTASRRSAVLADAGLEPLDDGPYRGFEHRVDQAIQRDVLVAREAGLTCPHGDREAGRRSRPGTTRPSSGSRTRTGTRSRRSSARRRGRAGSTSTSSTSGSRRPTPPRPTPTWCPITVDLPAHAHRRQPAGPAPRGDARHDQPQLVVRGDGGVQAPGRVAGAGQPHGLLR